MPRTLALDDAAFLHQSLAREQSALPILVVDEWKPPLIRGKSFIAFSGEVRIDDLTDTIRITPACHGSCRAGFQVREQRDAFFAIPGAFDRTASQTKKFAKLGGGARRLDLEIGDALQFFRHAREK